MALQTSGRCKRCNHFPVAQPLLVVANISQYCFCFSGSPNITGLGLEPRTTICPSLRERLIISPIVLGRGTYLHKSFVLLLLGADVLLVPVQPQQSVIDLEASPIMHCTNWSFHYTLPRKRGVWFCNLCELVFRSLLHCSSQNWRKTKPLCYILPYVCS